MSAEMSRTIAGIVAFYPDPARVLRLIASIADDVSRIVLFANSPLEAAIKNGLSTAAAQTSVTLIAPGENVGLGRPTIVSSSSRGLRERNSFCSLTRTARRLREWSAASNTLPTSSNHGEKSRPSPVHGRRRQTVSRSRSHEGGLRRRAYRALPSTLRSHRGP